MIWKYIKKITFNDNVIYRSDLPEKEICLQNKEKEFWDINNAACGTIPAKEVL